VAPDAREWIDGRMQWLAEQFGRDRLMATRVVLPTPAYFPDAYSGSEDDVRRLVGRVAGYMGLRPDTVDTAFYQAERPYPTGELYAGTVGLYTEEGGRFRIWLATAGLDDPASLVATIAHELGHVLLLGHRRVTGAEWDHEPLTDLLTVFAGLGVFAANAVVTERTWRAGHLSWFETSNQGYLTMEMFGYALARFATTRGEGRPDWARHLRPDVRKAFRRGMAWLAGPGRAATALTRSGTSDAPSVRATVPEAEADAGAHVPAGARTCGYCGGTVEVVQTDAGPMCRECRASVDTNTNALVAQREREARDRVGRGMGMLAAVVGVLVLLFLAVSAILHLLRVLI
jgi:hypothetical protein